MHSDGYGVLVPGVCSARNGWLTNASRLLTRAGYENRTVNALLIFIRTHSGLHESEFCQWGSVSRVRLNEVPPSSLVPALVHLLLHLGRGGDEAGGAHPLGAHPADTLVINVGLWGKAHGASHSARSVAPLVSHWAALLDGNGAHASASASSAPASAHAAHAKPLPLLVFRA